MTTTLTATGITFNDATSQTTTGVEIPAGTLMLFQQTSAPTGWTKQTTHNDKALRVVSGTAGSGGSVAFSTAMASQAVSGSVTLSGLSAAATTLSTAQMPSHTHSQSYGGSSNYTPQTSMDGGSMLGSQTGSAGGGGSHTHSVSGSASFSGNAINLAVQYVDLIIASKN